MGQRHAPPRHPLFRAALVGALARRVGSTRASFATYLIPVVALILGVVVRNEAISAIAVVGIAAVLLGAFLASRPDSGTHRDADADAGTDATTGTDHEAEALTAH